jgi:hypothetical protein
VKTEALYAPLFAGFAGLEVSTLVVFRTDRDYIDIEMGVKETGSGDEKINIRCTGACGCAICSKYCFLGLSYFWKAGAT